MELKRVRFRRAVHFNRRMNESLEVDNDNIERLSSDGSNVLVFSTDRKEDMIVPLSNVVCALTKDPHIRLVGQRSLEEASKAPVKPSKASKVRTKGQTKAKETGYQKGSKGRKDNG